MINFSSGISMTSMVFVLISFVSFFFTRSIIVIPASEEIMVPVNDTAKIIEEFICIPRGPVNLLGMLSLMKFSAVTVIGKLIGSGAIPLLTQKYSW